MEVVLAVAAAAALLPSTTNGRQGISDLPNRGVVKIVDHIFYDFLALGRQHVSTLVPGNPTSRKTTNANMSALSISCGKDR